MSRILLAISLFFLLILSSGWTLNVHYCMNRVEQVSLFAYEEHHCSRCGMEQEESNGCCHQEEQLVKLIQDQCPPQFSNYEIAPATVFISPVKKFISTDLIAKADPTSGPIHHPPPNGSPLPLFIRHGVFRI